MKQLQMRVTMARRGSSSGSGAENGIGERTENGTVRSKGESNEETQRAVVASAGKEKKKQRCR